MSCLAYETRQESVASLAGGEPEARPARGGANAASVPDRTRRVERAAEDLDCTPTRRAPTGVHKSQVLPECMTASPSHLPRPVLQMPLPGKRKRENAFLKTERRSAPKPAFASTNPKSCPLDPAGSSGPAGVGAMDRGLGGKCRGTGLGEPVFGTTCQGPGLVCLWQSIRPAPSPPLVLASEEKGKRRQMSGR